MRKRMSYLKAFLIVLFIIGVNFIREYTIHWEMIAQST